MEDERDAEDAIRGLDKIEFGRQRRQLTVEWTKSNTGLKPAKTLFVINFDPNNTGVRDLERHFEPYLLYCVYMVKNPAVYKQYALYAINICDVQ